MTPERIAGILALLGTIGALLDFVGRKLGNNPSSRIAKIGRCMARLGVDVVGFVHEVRKP